MITVAASSLGLVLGAGAVVAYALAALAALLVHARGARRLLVLAWLVHGAQIAWALASDSSHFGFAQALSVTVWLMLTVYLAEGLIYPNMPLRWPLAAFGALAVLLALFYPGARLPATSSPLLALHWVLGLAAYGLFAVAVAHGWLLTHTERQMRGRAGAAESVMPLLKLERLMFRFIAAGFVLLTLTLVAGVFFAEHLYGSGRGHWRLDHTNTFTLLSWLVFAVLLLGHWRFGWRGRRAVHVLYAGAVLLMLGYAGSRFVLEVLLERTP